MESAGAELREKVAIVTGGSAGIGAAIAKAIAVQGAKVIIGARREAEGKAAAAEMGSNVSFHALDVLDAESCKRFFGHVLESFGGLDMAVNNAGLGTAGTFVGDEDEAVFSQVVAANLLGTFRCMKHEINAMRARGGGAIVNVSSVSGLTAAPGMGAYIAAKHGLIGLTKTAAVEYATQGIRVNAVCPVATRTQMIEAWFTMPGVKEQVLGTIPAGRIAEPEEVAAATVFLLSRSASFVTGQALAVDGGFTAQ